MACEMCSLNGNGEASAEILDGSFARRPQREDATATLSVDGILTIETPLFLDRWGNPYAIELPVDFCPWCGEHLPIGE